MWGGETQLPEFPGVHEPLPASPLTFAIMSCWRMRVLIRCRFIATLVISLAALAGCSGRSTSAHDTDDDGGAAGKGGSTGATSDKGGASGSSGMSARGGTGGSAATGGSGGTKPSDPGACKLGPADVLRVTTANLGSVLKDGISAIAFVEGSALVGRALALGDDHDPPVFVDDATKEVDDLVDWLSRKVLAEGNALDPAGGRVSFRYSLQSDIYCAPEPEDLAADPEWAKERAADCARDLAEHPVSFDAVFDGCDGEDAGTITITPAFGSAHAQPFSVKAAPHSLAVTFDVAEGVKYATEQGSTTVFDADSSGAPVVTLEIEDPKHAAVDVWLDGWLGLGFTENGNYTRFDLAPSSALFHGTADATTEVLAGSFGFGAASLTTSFKTLVWEVLKRGVTPDVSPGDRVEVDIPASNVTVDYFGATDMIGLGRSGADGELVTARNATDTLMSARVNDAWNGNVRFDLDWRAGGGLAVTTTPALAVDLDFSLQSVADKVESLQSFANDDVVSISLEGDSSAASPPSSTALLLINDSLDLALAHRTPGDELFVEQGTFVMSSKAAGQSTTVKAGTCLVYDPNSQVAHEILRGYGAAACPSEFK